MDVLSEVGADGLFGERKLAGPVLYERIDVLKAVIAGADEVAHGSLIERAAGCNSPDGGDEGEAGERGPIFSEVVIDELFAGALVAVCTFFKGHERGVADEDCGVGTIEHGIEIGSHWDEAHSGVSPFVQEDSGIGDGGAACGVGCDGAQGSDGLCGSTDEQERADPVLRCDGAAGENAKAGRSGKGCDWDEANVCDAGCELIGTLRGEHPVEFVALGEFGREGRMFEVPHERRGIEEADGGDTKAGVRS